MGERTPKEIADGIVEKHVRRGEVGLTLAIEDAIRAALSVPDGYVRVPGGELRKVCSQYVSEDSGYEYFVLEPDASARAAREEKKA